MTRSFIAVDTGGTFTDLVAFDPDEQRIRFTKSLTTHANPLDAIFDCVAKTRVEIDGAVLFKHGTTLVINTLIERSGPVVALVTTKGFRDVIELARGNRVDPFDLFYRRSPVLVPRIARLEVNERVSGDGSILVAPQRCDIEALAATLRSLEVPAVAVSFLNAYIEPANERLVTTWLRELLPDLFISCGSELSREWHEYERTSTVSANAYTGPRIAAYIQALDSSLKQRSFDGQFLLMGSNGGTLSARQAATAPVMLVESGPIGGCIGACTYAEALGIRNLIAFDMGGTTAKAAVVHGGKFDVLSTCYVGGFGKGIPIRTPVVDIVEVGAGGGSIAWIDNETRLHVGPRSAGSMPGPVCYGRGGVEPTVTDANLVLGRLDASRFQGGEMALDETAARDAMASRLARPLGYDGEQGILEIANGILAIAAVTMSGAIKRITVERGKDPRDFALFAYGGGGPLHSVELARELGIPLVVIPPEPGNFSAIGMLLADIRRDDGRTFLMPLDNDLAQASGMAQVYRDMECGLRDSLCADFGDISIAIERYAEMRYVGQFHTVRIPCNIQDLVVLRRAFNTEYLARYGHLIKDTRVEVVSLHVVALARSPRPALEQLFQCTAGEPMTASRRICFPGSRHKIDATVYRRSSLPRGYAAPGPAVIEEYGSTTLIGMRDRFEIGRLGEIHIHVANRNMGDLYA